MPISSTSSPVLTNHAPEQKKLQARAYAERDLTFSEKIQRFIEYVVVWFREDRTGYACSPTEEQKSNADNMGIYSELARAKQAEGELVTTEKYYDNSMKVLDIYQGLWRGNNNRLSDEDCFYKIKQAYGEQIALFIQGKIASLIRKVIPSFEESDAQLAAFARSCFSRIHADFDDTKIFFGMSDPEREHCWRDACGVFDKASQFTIDSRREKLAFEYIVHNASFDVDVAQQLISPLAPANGREVGHGALARTVEALPQPRLTEQTYVSVSGNENSSSPTNNPNKLDGNLGRTKRQESGKPPSTSDKKTLSAIPVDSKAPANGVEKEKESRQPDNNLASQKEVPLGARDKFNATSAVNKTDIGFATEQTNQQNSLHQNEQVTLISKNLFSVLPDEKEASPLVSPRPVSNRASQNPISQDSSEVLDADLVEPPVVVYGGGLQAALGNVPEKLLDNHNEPVAERAVEAKVVASTNHFGEIISRSDSDIELPQVKNTTLALPGKIETTQDSREGNVSTSSAPVLPGAAEQRQASLNAITKKLLKEMHENYQTKIIPIKGSLLSDEEKENFNEFLQDGGNKNKGQGILKCAEAQKEIQLAKDLKAAEFFSFGLNSVRVKRAVSYYVDAHQRFGIDIEVFADQLVNTATEIIKAKEESNYHSACKALRFCYLNNYRTEEVKDALAFFERYAQEQYESAKTSGMSTESVPDGLRKAAELYHPQACIDYAAFCDAHAEGLRKKNNLERSNVSIRPMKEFDFDHSMMGPALLGSNLFAELYEEKWRSANDEVIKFSHEAKSCYRRVIKDYKSGIHHYENEGTEKEAKRIAAEAAFNLAFFVTYDKKGMRSLNRDQRNFNTAIELGSKEALRLREHFFPGDNEKETISQKEWDTFFQSVHGKKEGKDLFWLELAKTYSQKATKEEKSDMDSIRDSRLAIYFLEMLSYDSKTRNPEVKILLYHAHSQFILKEHLPLSEKRSLKEYREFVFQTLGADAEEARKKNSSNSDYKKYWDDKTDAEKERLGLYLEELYQKADRNMEFRMDRKQGFMNWLFPDMSDQG